MASIHALERQQRIDLAINEVFAFYGDALNLERLTPPWLWFELTTPGPIEMGVGTLIEHRTRIEAWEPPHRFVDAQVRGPYSLWEHTHTFEEDGPGATIIRDRVRYAIPFGPVGELAEQLLVRRDLKQIFDYRRDAVARELGAA
jgi:ligand-binding SRPBCC domain-containing protein